jgi:hypothetical protein
MYVRQVFKTTEALSHCYHGKGFALILSKNGLGDFLGDFFTNSLGHPANNEPFA